MKHESISSFKWSLFDTKKKKWAKEKKQFFIEMFLFWYHNTVSD